MTSFHDYTGPVWTSGELNPMAAAPGLPPAVADLIRRHTEAFFRWQAARGAVRTAAAGVEQARNHDRLAAAMAAAAGKPIPADPLPAAERALAEAKRTLTAHQEGVAQIEQQIRAAIRDTAPSWLAALDQESERAHTGIAAALDQLAAALRRRAEIDLIRIQVTDPYAKWPAPVSMGRAEEQMMREIRATITGQDESGVQPYQVTREGLERGITTRAELDAAGF